MKNINLLIVIVSVLTVSVWSCKPKQVVVAEEEVEVVEKTTTTTDNIVKEGDCVYKIIKGKGEIMRINFSNPDNLVILFDFMPEKGSGVMPSLSQRFNVKGVGKYPPRDWCEKNGIEQGAIFNVNQFELTDGSDRQLCEKTTFSFVDFEDKGWR